MLNKQKIEEKLFSYNPEAINIVLIIALVEIREAIDRYIEQRIQSDKTLEGILKDIYSAVQESGP